MLGTMREGRPRGEHGVTLENLTGSRRNIPSVLTFAITSKQREVLALAAEQTWGLMTQHPVVWYVDHNTSRSVLRGLSRWVRLPLAMGDVAYNRLERKWSWVFDNVAKRFLPGFDWYMHAEDDMYLYPHRIIEVIVKYNPSSPLIVASMNTWAHDNIRFTDGGGSSLLSTAGFQL